MLVIKVMLSQFLVAEISYTNSQSSLVQKIHAIFSFHEKFLIDRFRRSTKHIHVNIIIMDKTSFTSKCIHLYLRKSVVINWLCVSSGRFLKRDIGKNCQSQPKSERIFRRETTCTCSHKGSMSCNSYIGRACLYRVRACLSCLTLRDSRLYWLAWYSKSSASFSIPC